MEYESEVLSKAFNGKNFSGKNIDKKLSKLPGRVVDMLKENINGTPINEVVENFDYGHPASRKIVLTRTKQAQKVVAVKDRLRAKLAAKLATKTV